MSDPGRKLTLVLSGGNALGSYQGGALQALQERGLEPDWVIGTSIGAVNGAIFCGNAAEDRVAQLKRFWRIDNDVGEDFPPWPISDDARRSVAAAESLVFGQAGLFIPRHLAGLWWNPFTQTEPASLFDSRQLETSLERCIDFGWLNRSQPRFTATAVDIQSGEEVAFDTDEKVLEPRHLRASTALMPAFSPVEIDGRLFCDGGVAANLPLDPALAEADDRPLLCIALDLLPLEGRRPTTFTQTINRVQDLIYASQSRRTLAAWQTIFGASSATRSVTLLNLVYRDQDREVAGKAMDYSRRTTMDRWKIGYDDLSEALDQLTLDPSLLGKAGLTVYELTGSQPERSLVTRSRV